MTTETVAFIETSKSFPDLAAQMTPLTPSTQVYDLIAAGTKQPTFPDGLLDAIAGATGMAKTMLARHQTHIARHFTFSRTSESSVLALDALEKHFGYGLLLKVGDDRTLYAFTGTHWREYPDARLRRLLAEMSLQRPMVYGDPGRSVTAAINLIKDLAPRADDFLLATPASVINTTSHELWIGKAGEVEPRIHRPETGMRFVLPVAYDPQATAPMFDKAIDEIFSKAEKPEALRDYVLELMGYAMQGVRDIPIISFLVGGGSNGKSLLLNTVRAVVGQELVLASTLGALSADRFMGPELAGKLLFVEDDAKDGVALNDGLLKSVCENKVVTTRRVRASHATSYCSMVMPMIATNGAPKLVDTSHGMARRLAVVPFDRRFSEAEMDRSLGEKIIATELPGVLNRFIEGLSRLRARGGFEAPKDAERAKAAFLAAANPLHDFIQERCVQAVGKRVSLADLYQAYVIWMKQTGQGVDISLRSLKPKLIAMGFHVHKSSHMVVENLVLREG